MNCKIIVEVASNHTGEIFLCKEFIKIASKIGADYVKFQSTQYEDLVNKNDPQSEWIKKTSLSDDNHIELIKECKKNNIEFLTTCFSIKRVDFLASLGIKVIKIASPDLMSYTLIKKLADKFDHLIISTGMHTIREIEQAINFLQKENINATLLHTISIYPTPLTKAYMHKFLWLKEHYPKVGYSNHVPSVEPVKFAILHNATFIEVHMKLGCYGPGRTTDFDLNINEVEEIVKYKNILQEMLGDIKNLNDKDFLFDEEKTARKRFIGRWGNNR